MQVAGVQHCRANLKHTQCVWGTQPGRHMTKAQRWEMASTCAHADGTYDGGAWSPEWLPLPKRIFLQTHCIAHNTSYTFRVCLRSSGSTFTFGYRPWWHQICNRPLLEQLLWSFLCICRHGGFLFQKLLVWRVLPPYRPIAVSKMTERCVAFSNDWMMSCGGHTFILAYNSPTANATFGKVIRFSSGIFFDWSPDREPLPATQKLFKST